MTPTIQVGKKGLTEEQIKEITKQLNKKTVRIKLLKTALKDKERIFEELTAKTKAKKIKQVGNTIILGKTYKHRNQTQ